MSLRLSKLGLGPLPAGTAAARLPDQLAFDLAPPSASLLCQLRQRFLADETLASMLRNGHADALTVLFNRYNRRLLGIARRILRSEAEAEDAVQQVFLDVFRSIDQFDGDKGTFQTWLMMFAYQRIFNCRRSLAARRFFDTLSLEDTAHADAPRQPAVYPFAELSIMVEQALCLLQPRQRQTIQLIYFEGLTAEEASGRTGETVRVVRHNLYRGLQKLRALLVQNTAERDESPRERGKAR